MKALAFTFLSLLGLPIMGLAGCSKPINPELKTGAGYFQEVSDPTIVYGISDGPFRSFYTNVVFRSGAHLRTFNFCAYGAILKQISGTQVNILFHWDAQGKCDHIDDIQLLDLKPGMDHEVDIYLYDERKH